MKYSSVTLLFSKQDLNQGFISGKCPIDNSQKTKMTGDDDRKWKKLSTHLRVLITRVVIEYDHLRDPAVDSEQFRRDLKTYLFAGHLKR